MNKTWVEPLFEKPFNGRFDNNLKKHERQCLDCQCLDFGKSKLKDIYVSVHEIAPFLALYDNL